MIEKIYKNEIKMKRRSNLKESKNKKVRAKAGNKAKTETIKERK